jgi:hypothetical protein
MSVTDRVDHDEQSPADTAMAADLASFFELVQTLPDSSRRSREEIDRQIQLERDAWE